MPATIDRPHPGIESWVNPFGIRIVRLHYSADPEKDSAWAEKQRAGMTDPSRYRQEFEIDFAATLGERVFHMDEEATLCKSFPIPPSWTRYMALDPHERKPHAALYCAVDPSGDRWYYRELWPSVACGKSQDPPKEERSPFVIDYVKALRWLESADDSEDQNQENFYAEEFHEEDIYKRVIDYAARSFGIGSSDDEPQENMQKRFEERANEIGWYLRFEDCKKDTNASVELVNQGLKVIQVLDSKTDTYRKSSRIHIFEDRCPELVWELRNNRWSELTPLQAERQDVSVKQIEKRKHMTDCIAAGSLVRTIRGDVPIESVVIGDMALTRNGWRSVLDSWKVRDNAAVLRVITADGQTVTGTPDHRVWTANRQWVSLDSLRYGDILVSCKQKAKRLCSTAGDIGATQTLRSGATGFISSGRIATGAAICTATSGNQSMGQFPMAATFTTATGTRSIMKSLISSASRRASTSMSTTRTPSALRRREEPLTPSGIRQLLGTSLTLAGHGSRNNQKRITRSSSLSQRLVMNAVRNSSRETADIPGTYFVPTTANPHGEESPEKIMRLDHAPFVADNSSLTDTPSLEPVHLNASLVLGVYPAGTSTVHDLTIDGESEFFVNGVLVHNCMRYLESANPVYVEPRKNLRRWKPAVRGINF